MNRLPSSLMASLFGLAVLVSLPAQADQVAPAAVETPTLSEDVAAGRLPPVAERLPLHPLVYGGEGPNWRIGRHGGELRMLMSQARDTRMMSVYGYARLVGYDQRFDPLPDLLDSFEVEAEQVFTFHLRPGHRWSDGHPFTSDDFRYFWQDVANNPQLSPAGIDKVLLVGDEPPKVEFPDPLTVRYSWSKPNPDFLPALAAAQPKYLYRPAHYLKRFHATYAPKADLDAAVKAARARGWPELHNRMDNQYRNDNPDLPTLDPWVLQTKPPATRLVFQRNPYFHRVDPEGRQLPYIDRVVINIADGRIVPAKTGAGESDLQARYLTFNDYTFLRQSAKRNDFKVELWNTGRGAQLCLYPNLTAADPVWRTLLRDVRFRRALSLGIDRHEINQVVYFGLARESANTVLQESPLYRPEYAKAYTGFDLKAANRLLDEIGLVKRDSNRIRLLPDGRPLEIIVETAGEETEQTDVLELIRDTWLDLGIKLHTKPSQYEMFRNRVFAGDTVMSIWFGLESGLPTPRMSPAELAPTSQWQLQWPRWGQYYETGGSAGEAPDEPAAAELMKLYGAWRSAASVEERTRIWHRMLSIHAEQVYNIGLIAGVKQPVVISNHLNNVPIEGIYNFDPGAYFGLYRPDSFWFERVGERADLR